MSGPSDEDIARGFVVVDGMAYSHDGDAYTLAGVTRPPPEGSPVVTELVPDTFVIGSPSTWLSVKGSGFSRDTRIVFAGHAERTDFVDSGELQTLIDTRYWSGPGEVETRVYDPKRGQSNALPFTIASAS
jgi:hypothetical protein